MREGPPDNSKLNATLWGCSTPGWAFPSKHTLFLTPFFPAFFLRFRAAGAMESIFSDEGGLGESRLDPFMIQGDE